MRILLTNDDGIHSPGLWSAAQALKDVGEVCVVAPDRDQSGIGTAMTLLSVVRVHEFPSAVDGVDALSVQGTPADCVILATDSLFDQPFDLVVSGINQGANLGLDVVSSGTVAAAVHGYLRGISSIAVSVASLTDVRFEAASHTATVLAEAVSNGPLQTPVLLNVNVPNLPSHEIEGVEIAPLGPRAYLAGVERVDVGRRTHYWIRHNRPAHDEVPEGTDVWAVQNNRIAITPLDPAGMGGARSTADLRRLADEVVSRLELH